MSDWLDDLELIRGAAVAAASLAVIERARGLDVMTKPGGSPVTSADLAVDQMLKARLMMARPDYGWLSEETPDTSDRLGTRRQFVVDPIDGTRAFVKEQPLWCVPIAVVEDGQPVAAVVHVPSSGETYAAVHGSGASCNGQLIGASGARRLAGARMLADHRLFTRPIWPEPWPPMDIETRSAMAYRLCLVAAGAFDAALALRPQWDWDVCAGALIAAESGAIVSDHLGRPWSFNRADPRQSSLVCAAPELYPLIIQRTAAIALPA